ncbi:MAG: M48 family metallopeptidase [Planctomycetes bacterium]|nr:M48 family metallopeptidase [Planctomycetota bacterium]
MWELIKTNKRNSIILMLVLASVLLGLGYLIGFAFAPQAAWLGMAVAAIIWVVMALVSFSSGDQILLSASRAKPVTKDVHPVLFNVVEEMTISAGLPKMPKIYIINDPAPNAFATGRKPESASVAVTAGLLARLNRDELQGVIAHEISHIIHRDILYVTVAGIMLGTIVMLSHVFLRGMFYSSLGGSRRYSSRSNNGQAQLIMMGVALLAAVLAPIMAQLLYFSLSRKREYLADAGAARLTRYPEGLASALEKIAGDPSPQLSVANKATAPMYIANPFKRKGQKKLSNLTSTHPPIADRVKILRHMSGASYVDYSRAFTETTKQPTVLPASGLTDKASLEVRQGRAHAAPPKAHTTHKTGDIMRHVNGFAFLNCTCGLKLKIPPNFNARKVQCPRCKQSLDISK